jgi:hypothetical protein
MHPKLSVWRSVFDRLGPLAFRERKEGALHHLALVTQRHVCEVWQEEVELLGNAFLDGLRHWELPPSPQKLFPGE